MNRCCSPRAHGTEGASETRANHSCSRAGEIITTTHTHKADKHFTRKA